MEENMKAVEDMEKPWEQKLQEAHERDEINHVSKKENKNIPHLVNLNEDP
jgi:hypothetical protein